RPHRLGARRDLPATRLPRRSGRAAQGLRRRSPGSQRGALLTVRPMWGRVYDCVNGPLERAILVPRRAGLLPELSGVILDVGAGTGAKLPHYRSAARVIATEPSAGMRKR